MRRSFMPSLINKLLRTNGPASAVLCVARFALDPWADNAVDAIRFGPQTFQQQVLIL